MDLIGVVFVGIFVLVMGFNNDLGWSLIVNYFYNVGKYVFILVEGGYEWDGEVKFFDCCNN